MYHLVANICKRTDTGESLKNILYNENHGEYKQKLGVIRALIDLTLRNRIDIDNLIEQTNLSQEIFINELWVTRVLVAELVFGQKSYPCTDNISKKVYQHKAELKRLSVDLEKKERPFIPHYCRINTLKCTKHEFLASLSSHYTLKEVGGKDEITYDDFLNVVKNLKKNEFLQDYHLADLYIFHPNVNLTNLQLYRDSKIILQDKASCLVAPLLSPTPGSLMLDMCAAPGFKTQHLASISGLSGLIIAVDVSKERYNTLASTRINYDLTNVMTFNADSLQLPEIATKCIEYILLDAPCSGSGIVQNYDYGSERRKIESRLISLHNLQANLLRNALTLYNSVRRIVYSTCSINEEENEAVIDELLDVATENNFILVNLKNHLPDFKNGLDKYKCGKNCIRLQYEQSCTNGFFIALFERTNPLNPTPRSEFYKNLKDIMVSISLKKKKRKTNEDIVSDTSSNEVTIIEGVTKKSKREQGVKVDVEVKICDGLTNETNGLNNTSNTLVNCLQTDNNSNQVSKSRKKKKNSESIDINILNETNDSVVCSSEDTSHLTDSKSNQVSKKRKKKKKNSESIVKNILNDSSDSIICNFEDDNQTGNNSNELSKIWKKKKNFESTDKNEIFIKIPFDETSINDICRPKFQNINKNSKNQSTHNKKTNYYLFNNNNEHVRNTGFNSPRGRGRGRGRGNGSYSFRGGRFTNQGRYAHDS